MDRRVILDEFLRLAQLKVPLDSELGRTLLAYSGVQPPPAAACDAKLTASVFDVPSRPSEHARRLISATCAALPATRLPADRLAAVLQQAISVVFTTKFASSGACGSYLSASDEVETALRASLSDWVRCPGNYPRSCDVILHALATGDASMAAVIPRTVRDELPASMVSKLLADHNDDLDVATQPLSDTLTAEVRDTAFASCIQAMSTGASITDGDARRLLLSVRDVRDADLLGKFDHVSLCLEKASSVSGGQELSAPTLAILRRGKLLARASARLRLAALNGIVGANAKQVDEPNRSIQAAVSHALAEDDPAVPTSHAWLTPCSTVASVLDFVESVRSRLLTCAGPVAVDHTHPHLSATSCLCGPSLYAQRSNVEATVVALSRACSLAQRLPSTVLQVYGTSTSADLIRALLLDFSHCVSSDPAGDTWGAEAARFGDWRARSTHPQKSQWWPLYAMASYSI